MSHKYVCDCCGEDLYKFSEDSIGHFKSMDVEKDFCPWCSNYISKKIDDSVCQFKDRLKGPFGPMAPPEDALILLAEHDEYNYKYRIR